MGRIVSAAFIEWVNTHEGCTALLIANCYLLIAEFSGPGRIRTYNQQIMSLLL